MEELKNKDGITLIALIITVIVMLILVGVTITVVLNGGLFETATKAATETQKEAERERLTEIVLANYNASEGKITNADDLANKIKSNLGFNKDTEKSTDSKLVVQGTKGLWQIDLNSIQIEPYTAGDTYTFTIGELGSKGLLVNDGSLGAILASDFWRENTPDDLKNSTISRKYGKEFLLTYNITCSDTKYTNLFDSDDTSPDKNQFFIAVANNPEDNNDYVIFLINNESGDSITNDNYTPYADISFTISK